MDIRKNIYQLTDQELVNFQTALNRLKANGQYDDYVRRHWEAANDITIGGPELGVSFFDFLVRRLGPPDAQALANQVGTLLAARLGNPATQFVFDSIFRFNVVIQPIPRNSAHRGPAFLPWHRAFIRELELDLQKAMPETDPPVTLPYWDWATDSAAGVTAEIWNTDPAQGRIYIGGDGDQSASNGPFRNWTDIIANTSSPGEFVGGGNLRRELGGMGSIPPESEVTTRLGLTPYDSSPWGFGASGVRAAIEEVLHDPVHMWVGGSMMPMTSPNDPVFFLHHCNVDRIWASWQDQQPTALYEPQERGPWGHNLNDTMRHLKAVDWTPRRTLDYKIDIGYQYDQLVTP